MSNINLAPEWHSLATAGDSSILCPRRGLPGSNPGSGVPVRGAREHRDFQSIDPSNPADKKAHDELVRLVDRMLELHKQRAPLPESAERTRTENEIAATDERIDEIVYRLYGITEEERKIIEGAK